MSGERKLSDYVKFYQGKNQSRNALDYALRKIYDRDAFDKDSEVMTNPNEIVSSRQTDSIGKGDIIIDPIRQKAIVVGLDKDNLIIDNNFIKVDFISMELDKLFFVYMFNENRDLRRELEVQSQGSAIKKISIRSLNELEIIVPGIKKQKQLGSIYKESSVIKYKSIKKINLLHEMVLGILTLSINDDEEKKDE